MDIDLRTLCYVDHVNDNLICCICQQPFIEPVISTCGHTFCHHCILQALENSPHCPIDRTALTAHDVEPAAKIITNMVNELSVYCPRQEQGCPYQGQRQYIESHLKQDCQYIMAPCELEECKELLLKKDLSTHAETCNYRVMECNMCKKKLCAYEMEDHYNLCPSEIMTCPYCDTSRPRSEHNAHLHDCPQLTVSCHHSESGCPWSDQRRYLDVHLSTCVYESIQPFLHKQQQVEKSLRAELAQVHKENESLKRYQLESNQQIEFITRQLDLMFPGHFMSDVPQDARNESVLAENQRISHELETLNANMASLELKQNVALMTETFRLQEELQSLRAICHGLRMQMHYLMMERRTQASTSTTNANGNDVATTNALNRMRTWLEPRQETKL